MKKTFIHTFSNGDKCTLVLDFTGERGKAVADWGSPKENRFDQIEAEYIAWRELVFREFMDGMTVAEQFQILAKL
jgi:hypothetical protein